jgi:hypothetical protein
MVTIDELTNKFGIIFNNEYNEKDILNIFNCDEMDVINYDLTNNIIVHIIALYFEYILKDNKLLLKYYLLAIELGNIYALYDLGMYYNKMNDIINRDNYLLLSLCNNNNNALIFLLSCYSILVIYKMLLNIQNPNNIIINKINELNMLEDIINYNNKLLNATEIDICLICYENKLQITFECGHNICSDCYCIITKCYYR